MRRVENEGPDTPHEHDENRRSVPAALEDEQCHREPSDRRYHTEELKRHRREALSHVEVADQNPKRKAYHERKRERPSETRHARSDVLCVEAGVCQKVRKRRESLLWGEVRKHTRRQVRDGVPDEKRQGYARQRNQPGRLRFCVEPAPSLRTRLFLLFRSHSVPSRTPTVRRRLRAPTARVRSSRGRPPQSPARRRRGKPPRLRPRYL